MNLAQVQSLEATVLWASFGVCTVFGAVAQRTHFCTMGAVSDIVNIGNWVRMRMWGMAVGVAMIGFYAMAWLGWIDPAQSLYGSGHVPALSAVVGGALFGFGMVLASGYVLAVERLGFFLSTLLFLWGFAHVGGFRRTGWNVAIAVGGSLLTLVLFMRVAYISLPLGEGPLRALSIALLRLIGVS